MPKEDLSTRRSQVPAEDIRPVGERGYSASRLVIQEHAAERAGKHYDIRLDFGNKAVSFATRKGLPAKPGTPIQLFRQPDHVSTYLDWEGEIPKGEYGAGKVQKAVDAPVVLKATNDKIVFTVPEGKEKGTYVLAKQDDKNWLAFKKRELEPYWAPRPKYKEISEPDSDSKYLVTEKIDGAHFLAKVNPGGLSFTSQRKSVADEIISREDNVPHLRDLKLPKKYEGMVLRGELWHDKGFNTLSGILNSKPQNAVEAQNRKGLVRFAPFRIEKGPKGEESLPYEKQLEIIREISKEQPYYFEPPKTSDRPAQEFFREVGARKGEGVILVDKQTGENLKMKHRYDYDLRIAGFEPGEGKYRDKAIGAIRLTDKSGRHVGNVGTGLDDATRIDMYRNPKRYMGKIVKVESRKPLVGKLREPSFLGMSIDKNEPDEVV